MEKRLGGVIIKASSGLTFEVSGATTPNKKRKNYAIVTAKWLNVRTWAGAGHKLCSFSPLEKGDLISVCDAIKSASGDTWYYIRFQGQYGFVNVEHVNDLATKINKFITCLEKINSIVKEYPKLFYYKYDGSLKTLEDLEERVEKKKKIGLTCLVPMRIAFYEAGLKNKNGKSLLIGDDGSFKDTFNGNFPVYMTRITKGGAIGKTVKYAVDKDLLEIGDTICYEDKTHTFTYTGKGYIMYDGGHSSMRDGVYTGIKANYGNRKEKISEIIRWKKI